jgi:hypothetical protein
MEALRATPLPGGANRTIGSYIASWAAFSGAGKDDTTAGTASAKVPAALTLSTVPVRKLTDGSPDLDSVVKVSVGRASCTATDRR